MQYELTLIALMAFGGLLLTTLAYLNRRKIRANTARLTLIEKELSEWSKEINQE